MIRSWIYLAVAVVCEIIWAITLKETEGFTRLLPSVINLITLAVNLYFIAAAVKSLPVSIAYPIWTGLGGVGVVVCSLVFYKETLGNFQLLCIFMVIVGAVGLKLAEAKPQEELGEAIGIKLAEAKPQEELGEAIGIKLAEAKPQEELGEAIAIKLAELKPQEELGEAIAIKLPEAKPQEDQA